MGVEQGAKHSAVHHPFRTNRRPFSVRILHIAAAAAADPVAANFKFEPAPEKNAHAVSSIARADARKHARAPPGRTQQHRARR